MSWEPLASNDPIPGDPGQVATVADQLREIAAAIGEQNGRLRGVTAEAFWEGDAADRFEADKEDLPPLLDLVQRRYGEVGTALARYAPELAAAQELARRALAQARNAETDIASAERGIDRMDEYARDERARVRSLAAAYPDRPAPRAIPWTGPNYRLLLGDAQADLAAARALLDQAIDQNVRAAHAAARAISEAIHDDISNSLRSRAQAAAGWIAENFPIEELSAILGAIALIATVVAAILTITGVGLPIAAILFSVARVASAIKLGLDVILWAADDFSTGRGVEIGISLALMGAAAGLGALARNAHSAVSAADFAARANPSLAGSADDLARASRAAARARFFDDAGEVVDDLDNVNEVRTLPDAFDDVRVTADIYRSQSLAWNLPAAALGPAGIIPGVVAAAWLYHNAHRPPPPPPSSITPISPFAPAAP